MIVSKSGIQYARNVQDVRRASGMEMETGEPPANESLLERSDPENAQTEQRNTEVTENGSTAHLPQTANLRTRSNLKKPSRYNSEFIYNVFE